MDRRKLVALRLIVTLKPCALLVVFFLAACSFLSKEEAAKGLHATEVVSYWAVLGKVGDYTKIRPIVRFRIRNEGPKAVDYVQTMAVFRRVSAPDESWGSAFEYSLSGDPVAPGGESRVITLRSDSLYFSKDAPGRMFDNEEWEQVTVDVFVKVGPSSWMLVAKVEVPKRIGAPGIEKFLVPTGEKFTGQDGEGSEGS